ncbi:DUF983 domain-containing protein [Solihabitans fulvus]|uniref:DUF983 domain-containing protein n=1 Tax=Solihabitans fulvus TaxID=1892852 RepID=A0A5B2XIK6_9PSEU|nr:DUF983 domain-containing protein [Solihabitans fulvus]KAA2263688.1 DUF983 domain-containing protein [Solihabitans fulvus]
MTRLVRGADGRMWTVRGRVEWRNPSGADDFEHDVSGGYGPGVVLLGMVVVLAMVLVWWTPSDVIVPSWLVLALILLFLFFPTRWTLRRPWTLVAESPGGIDEHPPERWVGQVRGVLAVRQEAAKVARNIEVYSLPDVEGPLQPVD